MGTAVPPVVTTEEVANVYAPTSNQVSNESDDSLASGLGGIESKKRLLLIGAAAILFLGTGIGSFLAGKSSVNLKEEQKASYDIGFSAGDSAGYERGDSAGYDRGYDAGDSAGYDRGYDSGKTAGCLDVFSFSDGTYDYVTPYNPNSYYSKYPGSYYTEKSDC